MTELEITKQKAEAGDAEAQDRLGDMYRLGSGTEKNYEEALKWYKVSEAQGNISAHNHVGVMYQYGYAVEKHRALPVSSAGSRPTPSYMYRSYIPRCPHG